MSDADLVSSERVFDGKVFSVDRDEVTLPHGPIVKMDVVRHPKSVVIIPVPEAGHVTLIRQYRHAVNQWLWELPAGSVDEGETPEAAAKRECHEEIGLVPETIVRLAALYPTPGYCDEEMVFFRVSALIEPTEAAAVDEDEHIETRIFSIRDAREMARHGEILDMKTVVGLGML
ncbi:MAG: NUDIX hydrolase [Vicinamibacterales bacterium]